MADITHTDRAGWILTGGQSTRMGRDKAVIEIGGRPLAVHIAEILSPVCGAVSLVGDPQRYGSLGIPVVADHFPGHGPLAGIEAALGAASADWNLIVACDMPALDPLVLEKLFLAPGNCKIPRYADGKVEPLCAVYHQSCHREIRRALDSGIRKVTDALSRLAITYVPVLRSDSFSNLNTPDDVRLHRDGGRRNG